MRSAVADTFTARYDKTVAIDLAANPARLDQLDLAILDG